MHGQIFSEVKKFVIEKYGQDAWTTIAANAGVANKTYLVTQTYPDEEALALVGAASKLTGMSVPDILENFGMYLVGNLMQAYRLYVKPAWKTLDFIQHTEENIHKAVKLRNPGATPPELDVERLSEDQLVIRYYSKRQLCSLAIGMARGAAEKYGEKIEVSHGTCMHKGNDHCEIYVKKIG